MRKATLLTTGMVFLGAAGFAQAADVGPYLGASVGQSGIETDVEGAGIDNLGFDEEDTAWKFFAGYRFGLLGIEGGYVDFGSPDTTIRGQDVEVELTGWDLFGVLNLGLGPATVFAKAGVIDWESDAKVGPFSADDSGTDPAYGLGASFQIAQQVDLRAEYELFDVEGTDEVHMWSAGLEIGF